MFSRRVPAHAERNALTVRLEQLRAAGAQIIDLTETNPTRAGIPYPGDLLAALDSPAALTYEPHPFGLPAAREAVAADHERRCTTVDPAHVVLTASTSEAYSWLFKLLCNPGECLMVPRPSYPLFEHLTQLEGVRIEPYDLEYHGRWQIAFSSFDHAPADTRALLVVTPNNPTGSFVSVEECQRLSALCAARGWALVADEVFADYRLEVAAPITDLAPRASECLTFTLGGFSKSLGLPQLKLGWIVAGGPPLLRDAGLARLELIADSFLSVGTPVQAAAASLLVRGAGVRHAIHARVLENLGRLRRLAGQFPACEVLKVEGGWSAIVRVPATRSEEHLVLNLLDREHLLVHPGYFFDFPREAYIAISLLPLPQVFAEAVPRLLRASSC
jgi:alanine-synthesizing transaminase